MPKWDGATVREALELYADRYKLLVVTEVPVTSPRWRGWDEVDRRVVNVALAGVGGPDVIGYEEQTFEQALWDAAEVRPLLVRGYLDRYGFGEILTRRALLERTWQPTTAVVPVALVSPPRAIASNVGQAFASAGIAVEPVPVQRKSAGPRREGGGGIGRKDPWGNPGKGEDQLLHALWRSRNGNGWWLAEVPVGFATDQGPTDPRARRIDAIVLPADSPRTSRGGEDLDELVASSALAAELIEAKYKLNSEAIGQLLSGAEMFCASFPDAQIDRLTACVAIDGDAAMRWFCKERNIEVEIFPDDS